MELTQAQRLASAVLEIVSAHSTRAEVAGSVRRKKPSVKDIEIVAVVQDYVALYSDLPTVGRFIKPGCPDVIPWPPKVGAKYVRMLLEGQIKLDLFIGDERNWGALYCMRTGSAVDEKGNTWGGFIPNLFRKWKKVSSGGKMVGCMPTYPDGTQLAVPEERDFFDACKVRWVEPELRINNKAIVSL